MQHENSPYLYTYIKAQKKTLQRQRMADTDYVMYSHNHSSYHQQEGCMQWLEGDWIRANPLHAVVSASHDGSPSQW